MKYLKTFNESDDNGEYMDNLNKFHKKIMSDIKNLNLINKQYNFIDGKTSEIKELINTYLLTPKFRAGVLERYKVELPKIIYLQKKGSPNTEYHYHKKWQITDEFVPNKRHFELNIEIEIPINEEFREDNTVVILNMSIIPNNRRKQFYEYYNTRITTDSEGNFLKLADMIKKFGEAMNIEFEIKHKMSKLKF